MGNLTTFLYNYLKQKTGDRKSKVWLPKELKQYCPVKAEDPIAVDFSKCAEMITTTMVSSYRNMFNLATKDADPDLNKLVFDSVQFSKDMSSPDITFNISKVTMNGIENIAMQTLAATKKEDEEGTYTLTIPITGPAYPTTSGDLDEFKITLDFHLEQKLCAYLKSEFAKGNYVPAEEYHAEKYLGEAWPKCNLIFSGQIVIQLIDPTQSSVQLTTDVMFRIDHGDNGRVLAADVGEIAADIRAFVKNAEFKIESFESNYPDYDESFTAYFRLMMDDNNVLDGIMKDVFHMLNDESILKDLSRRLSGYTVQAFDNVLGEVVGELPTTAHQEKNAIDQYIFDRIRFALCYENSNYYLPRVISECKDPDLTDIDFHDIDLGGLNNTDGISVDKLILTHVRMQGLETLAVSLDDIGFVVSEETKRELATMLARLKLTITGGIDMSMNGESIEGDFTVTTSNLPFDLRCAISGSETDDFSIRIESARLEYEPKAIHISLAIECKLRELLEEILNTPGIQAKLLDALNDKLADNYETISNNATETIKNILNNTNM